VPSEGKEEVEVGFWKRHTRCGQTQPQSLCRAKLTETKLTVQRACRKPRRLSDNASSATCGSRHEHGFGAQQNRQCHCNLATCKIDAQRGGGNEGVRG